MIVELKKDRILLFQSLLQLEYILRLFVYLCKFALSKVELYALFQVVIARVLPATQGTL